MKTKKKVVSKPRKVTAKKTIKKTTSNLFTNAIAILAVITVGVVAWYFLPRGKKVDINYIGNASGVVDLSLSPATLELTPNQEATIAINMSSGSSKITATTIELIYDSSKIGTPVVTLGDFLPIKLVSVTTTNDKITFTVGAELDSGGSEGSGILATIKITPTIEGTSSISFANSSEAYVVGLTTNAIKSATGTAISVTTPMASVTPSADPTTGTSPSPSPSLSPSPSPSAPSAVRPAKPTGLRSNCYDGGNKITLRWDGVSNVDSYKVRMDQKDGNNDKSNDGLKSTEYSYDIIAGQKYSWWVHSVKNGLDSEEAKINEVVCAKIIASVTPTPPPTITPKPTTKVTVKPTPTLTAPVRTPSPTPASVSSIQTTAMPIAIKQVDYTCPELCGDSVCNVTCGESFQNCKADCTINDFSTGSIATTPPTAPLSFWQKIFNFIAKLFTSTEINE